MQLFHHFCYYAIFEATYINIMLNIVTKIGLKCKNM